MKTIKITNNLETSTKECEIQNIHQYEEGGIQKECTVFAFKLIKESRGDKCTSVKIADNNGKSISIEDKENWEEIKKVVDEYFYESDRLICSRTIGNLIKVSKDTGIGMEDIVGAAQELSKTLASPAEMHARTKSAAILSRLTGVD